MPEPRGPIRRGGPTSDLGVCGNCGSQNVKQIRTSQRRISMRVNGSVCKFLRLYLDRCDDCKQVELSGKIHIGRFAKSYLPVLEDAMA